MGPWLRRSGQAWKMSSAMLAALAGVPFFLLGLIAHPWAVTASLLGLILLGGHFILPITVGCLVCC